MPLSCACSEGKRVEERDEYKDEKKPKQEMDRRAVDFVGAAVTVSAESAPVLAQQSQNSPPLVLKFDREPQKIAFADGDVRLAGALLEPDGRGPFPAVVLVHGAGPGTHDEPAFIVHANAFLSQGFAVLTYDKRSSGIRPAI